MADVAAPRFRLGFLTNVQGRGSNLAETYRNAADCSSSPTNSASMSAGWRSTTPRSAGTEAFRRRGPSLPMSSRAAVSMDAVAARAGVSRATIYRWWPTKETLALDALFHEWAGVPRPRTPGRCAAICSRCCVPGRGSPERPYGRAIAALLTAAHTDPAFAREYRVGS